MMKTNEIISTIGTTYVLEDFWFGEWKFIKEADNKKDLEDHAADLTERIGKYGKFKWRIREKE